MDIAKLKELIALMAQHDLSEIDLRSGDDFVKLKRGSQPQTVINHQPVIYGGAGTASPAPATANSTPAPALAAAPAPAAPPAPVAPQAAIESPMVGTCYLAPNPDAAPFVKNGQQVGPETIVCLIEAMKVFNEIKAERVGIIDSVLVKTGQAVEFGQKLFALRPA